MNIFRAFEIKEQIESNSEFSVDVFRNGDNNGWALEAIRESEGRLEVDVIADESDWYLFGRCYLGQ